MPYVHGCRCVGGGEGGREGGRERERERGKVMPLR